ncbi:MAG: hypothetical protein BWY60_00008 [Actinobacteria bacterium ADurb.Bin346]|nr:MAG: hypothetical protein BWY60_00008 [Actinobacteria bacterium ADurb.Bin346]
MPVGVQSTVSGPILIDIFPSLDATQPFACILLHMSIISFLFWYSVFSIIFLYLKNPVISVQTCYFRPLPRCRFYKKFHLNCQHMHIVGSSHLKSSLSGLAMTLKAMSEPLSFKNSAEFFTASSTAVSFPVII